MKRAGEEIIRLLVTSLRRGNFPDGMMGNIVLSYAAVDYITTPLNLYSGLSNKCQPADIYLSCSRTLPSVTLIVNKCYLAVPFDHTNDPHKG